MSVTRIQDVDRLPSIGEHSKKVIKVCFSSSNDDEKGDYEDDDGDILALMRYWFIFQFMHTFCLLCADNNTRYN